jgi:hypothetical protein
MAIKRETVPATKSKRFKPKSDPKNIYSDTKRLPFSGETKEITRTRTAPRTMVEPYDTLKVSKPYNNFVLRKSQDRAVAKAKAASATKAAKKLASPPTKSVGTKIGKAPAAKFAEDVGMRGLGKTAGRVASKFAGPVSAAITAFEVGDALKDTAPALKARRALSDAAAEFTGLAKKEREALAPVIKARSLNPTNKYAKGGGIESKGKTKGKYI